VIHIDIDPAEIDKNVAAHIGLAGEIRKILQLLTEGVSSNRQEDWWQKITAWQEEFRTIYETQELTAPWIMKTISDKTQGQEYLFVTDVGQHQMWAAQHLTIETPRSWLTSGGLGAMGFGLPAAMGAQFAMPEKRVIHIAGDGGFKMTGNELYTIAVHELPIISVIINNNMLGMIHQLQHVLCDKKYTSCKLPPKLDFAAYAQAFGIQAVAVDTPAEFSEALETFMAVRKPGLIVANIAEEEMVTPMISPGMTINNYVNL
jgi:acetolactate synthase-1/2/3 large subunit